MAAEHEDRYRCEYGYWHVVPSLAASCSGLEHIDEEGQ